MKRKNCRRSEEERSAHEQAIRIRKMTDDQICDFIEKTYQEGAGSVSAKPNTPGAHPAGEAAVTAFLEFLESRVGSGNRIGKGTILYLRREVETAREAGVFAVMGQ